MPRHDSSAPIALGRVLPLGPQLEAIATDVLQGIQYSFVSAAAHPEVRLPFDSLEEAFQGLIGLRPPEQRWVYHSRARRIAMEPAKVREAAFGRYGAIGTEEFVRGGLAIACRNLPAPPSGTRRSRSAKLNRTPPAPETAAMEYPSRTTLALYITEVSCLEPTAETSEGEEVAVAGLAIDAAGGVASAGRFLVRDGFEHGVRKEYGIPGRKFCEFQVPDALGDHPLTYGVAAFLEVADRAGFSDGLARAWDKLSPILRYAVETRMAGAPAAALSRAAGWVLERFVRWLGDEFGDDLFPPGLAFAGLTADTGANDGEIAGAPGQFAFAGRRGRYRVRGQWRMSQLTLATV